MSGTTAVRCRSPSSTTRLRPVATCTGVFPADFICEAIDQTRGWFYSLLAESTLLFDQAAYRNVICLGLILDAHGQKMSKSRGNVIEPWSVLDRQGADAFRWYLLTAQSPWDSFRFSLDAVDESMRFLLTLWNTYVFLVTYAALPDGWTPGGDDPDAAERPVLDRWILSRCDRADRRGDRVPGGVRRNRRRTPAGDVRRRPVELVRPGLAGAVLGRPPGRRRRRRRPPGGVCNAARVSVAPGAAGRTVLPVRRRGALRQPRGRPRSRRAGRASIWRSGRRRRGARILRSRRRSWRRASRSRSDAERVRRRRSRSGSRSRRRSSPARRRRRRRSRRSVS